MKKILLSFFIGVMLIACNQKTVSVREVWTKEQANEWYKPGDMVIFTWRK